MRDPADPDRVIAAARRWIGTPYVRGAAAEGLGCDCIGLARGVWAEVAGVSVPPPAPPWSPDWAVSLPRLLSALGRSIMIEIEPRAAGPGDLVAIRRTSGRPAHIGILSDDGRIIHASEACGVVEVPLSAWAGRIALAFRFPAPP